MQELLDELFGAATGCCKGKGGSMHVGNMAKGMVPGIAIVGGGIPLAAGMALAFKMQKSGQVVACFFGDGAVAEGAFHEGVNMAAIWKLPVVFVCENNLYGACTHVSTGDAGHEHRPTGPPATASAAQTVDGNDVLAVYEAARTAVAAVPRRRRAGAAGTAHLSPHRPLAARPLPLSAEGGARGLGGPRSDRALRRACCMDRGLIDAAGLEAIKSRRDARSSTRRSSRPAGPRCPPRTI